MAQAQCPNCGGYKVNQEGCVVAATRLEPIKLNFFSKLIAFAFLAVGGWLLVTGLWGLHMWDQWFWTDFNRISWWYSPNPEPYYIDLVNKSIAGGLLVLIFIVGFFNRVTGRAVKKVPSVWQYNYSCELCGYRWAWRIDQPYPEVTINPTLINQAAQRLEEQRRNYEPMQAAWWLQQQQKQ